MWSMRYDKSTDLCIALWTLATQDGRTPLHWAASSGSIDITRYLIDQKAEVDKIDGSSWTALHIAG
jgi:ankyrin repeat protein